MAKFEITAEDIALIQKTLSERGNQSVLIRVEHGKLVIFAIQPKIIVKK